LVIIIAPVASLNIEIVYRSRSNYEAFKIRQISQVWKNQSMKLIPMLVHAFCRTITLVSKLLLYNIRTFAGVCDNRGRINQTGFSVSRPGNYCLVINWIYAWIFHLLG
jgi:hypothetical protein